MGEHNWPSVSQKIQLGDKMVSIYVPVEQTIQEAYRRGEILFPYWSRVWPSALALSRFLVAHPQYTNRKKVLELAAGLGLPSLVAAGNAHKVVCSDNAPDAIPFIQRSAAENGLKNLFVQLLDWNDVPPGLVTDVLLLSDVNYDPVLFATQQKIILSFLQKGTTVILSTPQRLVAKEFVEWLLLYCVLQEEVVVEFEGRDVVVVVMVMEGKNISDRIEEPNLSLP